MAQKTKTFTQKLERKGIDPGFWFDKPVWGMNVAHFVDTLTDGLELNSEMLQPAHDWVPEEYWNLEIRCPRCSTKIVEDWGGRSDDESFASREEDFAIGLVDHHNTRLDCGNCNLSMLRIGPTAYVVNSPAYFKAIEEDKREQK